MQASEDKVVSIHFTLTNESGEVIDNTSDGDGSPLVYFHGRGNIVGGLENAIVGKVAGDKFKVTLQPEDAFGVHDDNLIQTFERSSLQSSEEIRVGVQIDVHLSGEHRWVIVTKVDGDQITVDGNHPLADETLTFEGEVVEVREPTGEELTHGGHVHGPGGHH